MEFETAKSKLLFLQVHVGGAEVSDAVGRHGRLLMEHDAPPAGRYMCKSLYGSRFGDKQSVSKQSAVPSTRRATFGEQRQSDRGGGLDSGTRRVSSSSQDVLAVSEPLDIHVALGLVGRRRIFCATG